MISSRATLGLQRAAARSSSRALPSTTRRQYTNAADAIKGEGKGPLGTYTIGALLVAVPVGYYLWGGSRGRGTPPTDQDVVAGGGGSRDVAQTQHVGGGSGDTPLARQPPTRGGTGDMASKQAGVSTGPTAHSLPMSQNPNQSNKGEGVADSVKMSETIRPDRPMSRSEGMRENQEARKTGDTVNKPS